MADVARSLVPATSSSRFTEPNYWRDPASAAMPSRFRCELPQNRMQSVEDVGEHPGDARTASRRPLLGDVAELKYGHDAGEIERYNGQRVVSLTANIHGLHARRSRAADPARASQRAARRRAE